MAVFLKVKTLFSNLLSVSIFLTVGFCLTSSLAYSAESTIPSMPAPALAPPVDSGLDQGDQSKPGSLSFNFQNIEVRALLQIITKTSGLNFIISDAIKGSMTLSLKDVTWQQALNTVLAAQNLSQRRVGNVIFITTSEEMAASLAKQLQSSQVIENLEPLSTEIVRLKYTDGETMAKLLKGQEGGASLLSSRGQVGIDPRTNSLIVMDTRKKLVKATHTIRQLDVPAKQVLIEARIVNLDTSFESQLGVKFGVSDTKHLSGTLSAANQITGGTSPSSVTTLTDRLNFNGPAAALSNGSVPGSIGLALARLGPVLLDMELSALESEGHAQIISKPRVVTSNQQKAVIQTGEEIPYQEATSSGATSIAFKKAVLSLEVTPQITPNNKVILKLKATQDTRGPQLVVQSGGTSTTATSSTVVPTVFGPPTINTQSVESFILLDDNETFVVGGVYKITKTNTMDRIPFFGSLPIVGALFRHKGEKSEKTELLVFITPKIINKGFA